MRYGPDDEGDDNSDAGADELDHGNETDCLACPFPSPPLEAAATIAGFLVGRRPPGVGAFTQQHLGERTIRIPSLIGGSRILPARLNQFEYCLWETITALWRVVVAT